MIAITVTNSTGEESVYYIRVRKADSAAESNTFLASC